MSKVADRLPDAKWIGGNDAGMMMPGANWLFLLHTGETNSFGGLVDTLRAKNAWPHLIGDVDDEYMEQALNFNRAGRALRSGGNLGRTNAMRVVQIELVGFAHETPFWTPEKNKKLGRMIARVAGTVPFALSFPRPFLGDADGVTIASENYAGRFSYPAWYAATGIVGHQHAPRPNHHWDPGHIDVNEIALGFGKVIQLPVAKYEPPRYDPKIGPLHEGPYNALTAQKVREWKLMMKLYGITGLDMSTPTKAGTFGHGTANGTEEVARLYYANLHQPFPKGYTPVVGPKLWEHMRNLLIWKHAIEQQAKAA